MANNFGFLIYDGVEELDVVGPWEIIKIWSEHFQGPQAFTVSQKGGLVTCARGMRIDSDYNFANCPPLNYLLVPGGRGRKQQVNNPALINFIKQQAQQVQQLLSVCTGAFLLQKAGLLKGHKATTYWSAIDELKQFPEIKIKEERYIKDKNIWTGAGVSSGIDLALALIADVAGKKIAGKVQLLAEYFPPTKIFDISEKAEQLPAYIKKLKRRKK